MPRILAFVWVPLVAALFSSSPTFAQVEWVAGPDTDWGRGHLYALTARGTWEDVEAMAVAAGGHLVTINCEEESTWLFNTFREHLTGDRNVAWIGMNDAAAEGHWMWVAGDGGWWERDNPASTSYTNWYGFEPSGGTQEQHAAIYMYSDSAHEQRWLDHEPYGWQGIIERTGMSDSDGDSVDDGDDLCPGTGSGAAVDANGCSDDQVDGDDDGYCAPSAPSGGPSGCVGSDCNEDDPNIYPGAADDQCDAVDNDCDGTADDDYVPPATNCGVGVCAGNAGLLICVAGSTVDTCDPLDGATPEVCDALDNDCDGAADEDIAPVPTICGVGECAGNTGEEMCVNGVPVGSCDPYEGAVDEICDALDNDCDGDVDEGFDADGDLIADCFDDCPYDADNDTDGDAVCGDVDVCDETVIAEGVPTHRLGVNRFALMTAGSTEFDTTLPPGGGNGPGLSFTTGDTAGCSCEQIIEALELGNGHVKFGCSISAIEAWVALVNPQ